MSTGNNQGDTLVSKKRKRIVRGYIHPIKPEIKKFDFFNGDPAYSGSYRISNSRTLVNIFSPAGGPSSGYGSFQLVDMANPTSGTDSNERIGMKYNLKYIKFKGHISVSPYLPFTIHYKLVLIKSDKGYSSFGDFCAANMNNYEPYQLATTAYNHEYYARHNFYKLYKNFDGMSDNKTSVTTIASGTISPLGSISGANFSTSLGTNPTLTYYYPEAVELGSTQDYNLQAQNILPISSSVTVNDCVTVNNTHFYLCLLVDHAIGIALPNTPTSTSPEQFNYRGSVIWSSALLRFNFFGICYYTDY